jgi:hypothetical protein
MMMFTKGQVKRMRSLFSTGGIRESIRYSKALGQPWNDTPASGTNTTGTVTKPAPMVESVSIKLYPNPAVNNITISSEQTIAGKSFALYAADGKIVTSGTINSNVFNLNISSLHRGIYFIKLGENAEKQVLRFVKQ